MYAYGLAQALTLTHTNKNSLMITNECLVKNVPMCVQGPHFLLLSNIQIKRLPALLTKNFTVYKQ